MRLKQGDRVAIASFAFLFTGETLEPIDMSGRVCVEVRGLYKEVVDRSTKQTRRLLDDISLVIEPGEFVVIFGTSGSGKSTLLDALNGRRPATGGQVLYNGTDLYASFDAFRATIGYVPQQDIVHRKISVRHALEYTAHLRLPPDSIIMRRNTTRLTHWPKLILIKKLLNDLGKIWHSSRLLVIIIKFK